MKKASKLFTGFVSKGKKMLNGHKKSRQSVKEAVEGEGAFESGEDDDLIEIGRHEGVAEGEKSTMSFP